MYLIVLPITQNCMSVHWCRTRPSSSLMLLSFRILERYCSLRREISWFMQCSCCSIQTFRRKRGWVGSGRVGSRERSVEHFSRFSSWDELFLEKLGQVWGLGGAKRVFFLRESFSMASSRLKTSVLQRSPHSAKQNRSQFYPLIAPVFYYNPYSPEKPSEDQIVQTHTQCAGPIQEGNRGRTGSLVVKKRENRLIVARRVITLLQLHICKLEPDKFGIINNPQVFANPLPISSAAQQATAKFEHIAECNYIQFHFHFFPSLRQLKKQQIGHTPQQALGRGEDRLLAVINQRTFQMKNIKLLKPQPSPKNTRDPLANITNCFQSRSRLDKDTYRSPSHSPKHSSRVALFEKEGREGREGRRHGMLRQYTEAKFANNVHRCVNHKEKTGKFKVESENSPYFYCENCAVELNQRGKRLTAVKGDDLSSKMVNQAKQYVRSCEQVLSKLGGKLSELKAEKVKVDCTYLRIQEDIECERTAVLRQINEKYDKEIRQQENERKKLLNRLQEEEFRLTQFEKELQTVKVDIADNMKEINVSIENAEFREIMDIYWRKIRHFEEMLAQIGPNHISESSQVFIQKYLPPIEFYPKIEPATHTKTPSQNGKQFTFSKNYWDFGRAKEANSWEGSKGGESGESGQSYVQERIRMG